MSIFDVHCLFVHLLHSSSCLCFFPFFSFLIVLVSLLSIVIVFVSIRSPSCLSFHFIRHRVCSLPFLSFLIVFAHILSFLIVFLSPHSLYSNKHSQLPRSSLQILLLEELHHAIAVLVRRQIPQRDPHSARHHSIHHRQRRLMHALAREALMLPDLLNHHLLRQSQRRVRRSGVAVPSSAQLARSFCPNLRGFGAARPLFPPRRTKPASRSGPLRCTANQSPTHVDRHDGALQSRGSVVVAVDAKERRSVGMTQGAQFGRAVCDAE